MSEHSDTFDAAVKRIAELELRITFQEDQLEGLQRALFEQSQTTDRMAVRLDSLVAAVRLGQGGGSGEGEEPPPPHY